MKSLTNLAVWLLLSVVAACFARAQTPVVPAGSGTEANPYQISVLGNLVWMGNNVGLSDGSYYKLINDIDASATTNWNSGAGFMPIGGGQTFHAFGGIFDGNRKVIANLKINRPDQDDVGLFGQISDVGAVYDLGIEDGSVLGTNTVGSIAGWNAGMVVGCYATGCVTGYTYVGGIVGWNDGTVGGCHATGSVTGRSGQVGGLVGINYGGTVSNSSATGPVTGGGHYVGGLVGWNAAGIVTDCFATGQVRGVNNVGALVGINFETPAIISRCYASGAATGIGSVGGLVGWNIDGAVTDSYWDTNTTGLATSAGGGIGTNTASMKQQATFAGWDFTNVWRIKENVTYPLLRTGVVPPGVGTVVSPYLINEPGNLVWMEENVGSSSGRYYTVQNRIDASDTARWNGGAGFAPIGSDVTPFDGIFNGGRKVITGLTINRPAQAHVGLFGFVGSSGMVVDLGLSGSSVTGSNEVGAIAGENHGTLSNCYATSRGAVWVTGVGGGLTGGLVGLNHGTVSECYATINVAGYGAPGVSYVGGLVGENTGTVINCYSESFVQGGSVVGGLVGNNGGIVSKCYAAGPLNGPFVVGGLVGWDGGGTVDNSYWDMGMTEQATSAGGTGTNTAAMMQQTTFVGWDFDAVWRIAENRTYPLLQCFPGSTGLPWLGLLLGQ